MDQENRVVVLIDMDCFYCQVEQKLNPDLAGKPIAVVQYNPWKGGGYRDAGKEVARVLQKFTPLLERASIDEAYLDITATVQERLKTLNVNIITTNTMPNTFALGYDCVDEFLADVHTCGMDNIDFDYEHAKRLAAGAVIVSEIRAAVFNETGYRCSAGISHNKILAKLVCGMNKPNKQTILPKHCINILYKTLSVKKVKHLGGKFGDTVCEVMRISKMAELQRFTEKELQTRFDEKNGTWLYNIARGTDLEPVQARFNPKSIGCCKQFRGKAALLDSDSLFKWLKDLGEEIDDRLEKDSLENNRTPKQMVVSYSIQMPDGRDTSSSRSYNFVADEELCGETFSNKALELVLEGSEGIKITDCDNNRRLIYPIKFLGISVGKFEDNSETKKTKKILDYFGASSSKDVNEPKENLKASCNTDETLANNEKSKINDDKCSSKHTGKDFIMKRFLQGGKQNASASSKADNISDIKETTNNPTTRNVPTEKENNTSGSDKALETSLDKQESFFAKILNQNKNQKDALRSTTPVCDVIKCGEDSNDTDYSGSTINNEIDKSMSLFEDDPVDVARVANIRQLMHSKRMANEEEVDEDRPPTEHISSNNTPVEAVIETETYTCTECGKSLPIAMVPEHSDYHLALKLREEERQHVRKEIKDKKMNTTVSAKKTQERKVLEDLTEIKKESTSSIASFLVKVDSSIPTEACSECGKKVPLNKFGEHLDFHEAQKISREINRKTNPQFSGSSFKRKRKSTSPIKKPKLPCRPIDSFFR